MIPCSHQFSPVFHFHCFQITTCHQQTPDRTLVHIQLEGVSAELEENGFAKESIDKYLDLFKGFESSENGLEFIYRELGQKKKWSIIEKFLM